MAAEPEKKIEELLHAYSRKRREDAAAPLEVHPATRRMLQGEVARQAKSGGASSASPRPWWKTLLLIGPKYAGAVGMFAILALGVWVITQQDNESRRGDEVASQRAPAADADASRKLGESAKRGSEPLREVDDFAGVPPAREEALNKKAEAPKARGALEDQTKLQFRDAEKSPAPSATPVMPEVQLAEQLGREKQVVLQGQAEAGQKVAEALSVGSVLSKDKSAAVAGDALGTAPESRFSRVTEAKTDALAVPPAATQPLTARLDLAAAKVTDNLGYAIVTNVTLATEGAAALSAGVTLVTTTNAPAEMFFKFADGSVPAATEWSAVATEPAKNEITAGRPLRAFGGVAQQFEEREGVAPALLRNFSVQQSNGRIRIRDADDGSVYDGEVLAASESNVGAKEATDELRRLRRNVADARSTPVTFRASGVNQRSKQVVIINGELSDEQERVAGIAGKVMNDPAAPAAASAVTPSPTTTLPSADRPSAGQRAQAGAERQPQGQTASRASAAGVPATTSSTGRYDQLSQATTLRARVQIGATNELNFRAVRTK